MSLLEIEREELTRPKQQVSASCQACLLPKDTAYLNTGRMLMEKAMWRAPSRDWQSTGAGTGEQSSGTTPDRTDRLAAGGGAGRK